MNARLQDTQPALSAEQAIGQIAVELPGSTAVFRRLKLDFCCGGQISLREAAAQKSLDVDAILAELERLFGRQPDKIFKITDLIPELGYDHVPDPYYTGDFSETHHIVSAAAAVLVQRLQQG